MRKLYPVSVCCEVLEVSASGYFNWLRRRESGHGGAVRHHSDEALLAHIRAIHAEVNGEYGWPRMHKELLARGIGQHRALLSHFSLLEFSMTDTGQAAACPNDSSPAAHDKAAAGTPLFALGQLLATPGALELLETHELTALPFVLRHVSGDWGDICAEDRQANADALHYGYLNACSA